MSGEDFQKFASQTMIEVAKLLITLASGFFVLSTTLISILSSKNEQLVDFWTIIAAWACLIASIGSGTLALGGIATSAHNHNKFDVDAPVTCWALRVQQVLFVLAFIFVTWFAVGNE